MIYLDNFLFAGEEKETKYLYPKDLTPEEVAEGVYRDFSIRAFTGSVYPFDILTRHHFERIGCEEITILCGGNGSGKTTALNVIAEKLGLNRETLFNRGELLEQYLEFCRYNVHSFAQKTRKPIPPDSRIIVSDDVFQYNLKRREHNDRRLAKKAEIDDDWFELQGKQLSIFDDPETWTEQNRMSKSQYIRKYLKDEEKRELSNGESGFQYFVTRIENPGLYLLDEPENSLSLERQIELANYLVSSARYFDCQFIIATHSPIFLAMSGAKIYDLDADPVDVKPWTELNGMREWFNFFMDHRKEFEGHS